MATPFVQGRLRGEPLSVDIESSCACCGRALRLTVDSEMVTEVHSKGAEPLVFEPDVDWARFRAPTIIDDY
jgi:hypothetical protein